ncbi:homocysteine S-methyltransferase YbgG-like [Palaemon carinicauda]|uniref:homocysteine S-methyltransferase YbgG-like n=1 Tax=Palaemon carinicauda TaxID=392227 RepID=UPI0035B67E66
MLRGRNWLVDGGLGFALEEFGFGIHRDPLWSARLLASNPNAIKEVHKAYLEAGAEIIITSSYQASIQGFCSHLEVDEKKAMEHMELSVQLAKDAVKEYAEFGCGEGKRCLVAGSIGPYGACQADMSEYHGKYVDTMTKEELMEWHRPRMKALINAGVDFLAIETIPSLKEALAVLSLLRTFPNAKAWMSFSCRDGHHTNYGDDFSEAVKQCYVQSEQQLIAVGMNCTPPEHIASLLEQANVTLPPPVLLPRVVYPNHGEKWLPDQGLEGASQEWPFIKEIPRWASLGATAIGGCCGLGPNDLKKIASAVAVLPYLHE